MPVSFARLKSIKAPSGAQLRPTDWLLVEQSRIDQFAEATGDHQWIHVDPERAHSGSVRRHDRPRLPDAVAGESTSCRSWCRPKTCKMGINYGCDRVRFPSARCAAARACADARRSSVRSDVRGRRTGQDTRDASRARGRRQAGLRRRHPEPLLLSDGGQRSLCAKRSLSLTARTPIGKAFRGAFNDTEAPALSGHAVREAVRRAGVDGRRDRGPGARLRDAAGRAGLQHRAAARSSAGGCPETRRRHDDRPQVRVGTHGDRDRGQAGRGATAWSIVVPAASSRSA